MNRVRGIKNLIWISIVAMLVMAMGVGVGTSSPAPTVYVDPLYSSAAPGETFDICVMVSDVEDLFVGEFFLAFDPGILELVDDPATTDIEGINPCERDNSLEVIWYEQLKYDSVTGWMEIRTTPGRPLYETDGLSGTVGMAKISFEVIGTTSKSILKLYWTDLINPDGDHIENYAKDGRFKNIYPILWIRHKGTKNVWAEWGGSEIWFSGLTNTLYAKVKNTGIETATFRVKFKGMGPEGPVSALSNEDTIGPGEIAIVWATIDVAPGQYNCYGTIEYEIEPGAIPPYAEWVSWEDVEPLFGGEGTSKETGQAKFKAV